MLNSITTSTETNLYGASLHGAAIMLVSRSVMEKLQPFWPDILGIFSPLAKNAPDHWIEDGEIPPYSEKFDDLWRAWASEHHPGIKIYPDYRDQDPD